MADVRLIDANALLKECEKRQEQQTYEYCDCFLNDAQEISTEWWCVEDMVMAAPTIDAVPVVHARWVHEQRYGDSGGWVWRCSACRRESITCIISAMKYCHACGAKMDGGEEDALALIQQLEAQVPRWIPVEERLPNSYCGVLCTDGERVFRAAYLTGSAYIPDHWAEIMDDRTGHIVTTQKMSDPPSHWMPLPEPPKEE